MPTFKDIYTEYEQIFRKQLLDKLYSLSPHEFEHFARKLLSAYGFNQVEVTQASKDGGIDGHGDVKLGLATMKAAFQCKRWKGNVGRKEVDTFRGAIQGEFEQGIFFTTGDYTEEAKKASIKKGAVPVILLNGDSIVDLMIEKELGVERVPLYIYRECPGDFMVKEEAKAGTSPVQTDLVTIEKTKQSISKTDYTGQSITSFTFNGTKYEVQSWIEMLVQVCQMIYSQQRERFEQVLSLVGRKRPYFTRNPEELRFPTQIMETGLFVEKNLNATTIVNLSRKITSLFGYVEDKLSFETKERPKKTLERSEGHFDETS